MSILLLGKSTCRICGLTINEGDQYYCFPAFVINISDELFLFSDNNFHLDCLNRHKSTESAKKYADLFIEKIKPQNRICLITGKKIINQEDHIYIGYLTSNDKDYLHQFNFTHVCKSSLYSWESRKQLVEELIKLKNSGKWKESNGQNYLENLIKVMDNG
ncbi:MAG TPA: hypothetical protein VHD83_12155 [Puia sp.]|nr:hypothetical protein [Puia sp.]